MRLPLAALLLLGCPKRPEPPVQGAIDASFTDDVGTTGRYTLIVPPTAGASPGVLLADPEDAGRDPCWWAPEVERNAHYVDRFITDVLIPTYAIDPNRVFLTGLSGGSDFAAAFPYHTGYRYGGGVVARWGPH